MDPVWLEVARKDIGLKEIKGPHTEPRIAAWLKNLKAWWDDDETPWCGTAVAAWMSQSGIVLPQHWYRAKGWLDWGTPCGATLGAVVVFERTGGGHVGLVVGYDDSRNALLVLGGNQGDAVSIKAFAPDRILGYRWPFKDPPTDRPPYLAMTDGLSRNEA